MRPRCAVSVGLIVKTADERIVLLRRKVPYCVQAFYYQLQRRGVAGRWDTCHPFPEVRARFEREWGPRLAEHEARDYRAFRDGEGYEDAVDFPHGQVTEKRIRNGYQLFAAAYREFREETGFKFAFTERDVRECPLVRLQFWGCDGVRYTQYYFIVENAKGLRRFRYFDSFDNSLKITTRAKKWTEDRFVYEGKLVPLHEAYRWFLKQQQIKHDKKYLFCQPKECLALP